MGVNWMWPMRVGETIKTIFKEDFSKKTAREKQHMAEDTVKIAGVACGLMAIQPLPFADIMVLTPIQVLMVIAIGHIYGYKVGQKQAKAIIGTVGAGWLAQQGILVAYKTFLPFAGGLFTFPYVFAATWAIGKTAILFFESGMKATKEEMRREYKKEKKKMEKDKEKLKEYKKRAVELKKLEKMYRDKMIKKAEFDRRRKKILDNM